MRPATIRRSWWWPITKTASTASVPPIVRDVIKSYFDKKVRKQQLEVAKNSVPQLLPRPATDQPTVAGPPEVLEPRKKEEPEIIE